MRDKQPDEQHDNADYFGYATDQELSQPGGQEPSRTLPQESSFLLTVPGQAQPSQDTVSRWGAGALRFNASPDEAPGAGAPRAKGAAKGALRGRQRQEVLPDETPVDQRDPAAQARSPMALPLLGEHDDTALAQAFASQRAWRPRGATGANTGANSKANTGAPTGAVPEGQPAPGGPGARGADNSRALAPLTGAADRQLSVTRDGGDGAALLIRGANRAPRALGRVVPQRRGSFTSQFIVAMLSAMLIASVLTLTTPLGQNAVFGATFHAYANAVPFVPTATSTLLPTATPAPPPGGYNPGQRVIINYIISVFGVYAQGALNVSHCESGYDPNAVNPFPIGNSHASGVFQILYPSTWDSTSFASYSPFNYQANVHAAYQIFSRDGYSWREWQCQP